LNRDLNPVNGVPAPRIGLARTVSADRPRRKNRSRAGLKPAGATEFKTPPFPTAHRLELCTAPGGAGVR